MNAVVQPAAARRSPYADGPYFNYSKDEIEERFGIRVNDQQLDAINAACNWYEGWCRKKHRQQTFFLAGYAGTGKTTIAKIIAALTVGQNNATYIAPTGKAASRLRFKGCAGARTLHNFIYRPAGEDEDGEPIFTDKGSVDTNAILVIMDEASMVGEWDNNKLLARRLPILALGDPGQVEPVKDKQVYHEHNADVIMDSIERNAGNIVRASMFVRKGSRLPVRSYDDFEVRVGQRMSNEELAKYLGEDAVILCARNNTRQAMNRQARKVLGFTGQLPMVGEKIVCLANQHEYGVMNGEQGIVLEYIDMDEDDWEDEDPDEMQIIRFKSLTDGKERKAKFNPLAFTETRFEEKTKHLRSIGAWDFGYALTVHKSQGSEWPRGVVIEESIPGCAYSKLMYTAITRFIDYVLFLRAS